MTDHALVQWFGRYHGIDLAAERRKIVDLAMPGIVAGARRVKADGVEIVLVGKTVVTVTP